MRPVGTDKNMKTMFRKVMFQNINIKNKKKKHIYCIESSTEVDTISFTNCLMIPFGMGIFYAVTSSTWNTTNIISWDLVEKYISSTLVASNRWW